MPSINIYTDPLKPGRAQMPSFVVGDDQNWDVRFFNGNSPYNPTGVTMRIGYVAGLENLTFASAFEWIDRLNNRHIGSFVIAAGVPGTLTWDEDPIGVLGGFGSWLLKGRTPPSSQIRKVYVINGGSGLSSAPRVDFNGGASGLTGKGATAVATVGGGAVTAITLTEHGNNYSDAPIVRITGGGGTGAIALATVAARRVSTIAVTQGGTGYTTAPTITIIDPEASATAAVSATSAVAAIALINAGAGYTSAPTVAITGGGGANATATATIVGSSWPVASLTLTNPGSGYTSAPAVGFSGGAGAGAAATAVISEVQQVVSATITDIGHYTSQIPPAVSFTGGGGSGAAGYAVLGGYGGFYLASIVITNPGSGYTSAPTVVLTKAQWYDDEGAATAVRGDGTVKSLVITTPGSGYTSAPTVAFTGGGGTAAAATAVLTGSPVATLTLTAGGTGYTSAPVVGFSSGGGTGAVASAFLNLGITSITLIQPGFSYATRPTVTLLPGANAQLDVSGIETHTVPYLRNMTPLVVQKAVTATPYSTGRRDSSGNWVYDDSLLIIRPRQLLAPTLTLQIDALTWHGVFTPVTDFVTALLNFQRSVVVDVEIFGGGRLLLQTKLAIIRA